MKVIFSHTLSKKEKIANVKKQIIEAYAKGIFTQIKGDKLPPHSSLIKIYTTTIRGAGRLVFLVDIKSTDGFFLFFRTKNDEIGRNITIKNAKSRTQLHRYLELLKADLREKNYEVFEVR
ncbi:MAG: hypothetical protein ACD_28C00161G0002 [uncultured bacterium]|nr:MAG: hypothetical protein ACD_28C00161G0002 [uncultured bacterium]KKT75033.1 MAG: hypothetical protein UW70_C0040G0008 [Candidatus Peregrinibacteria bacterium GW2011_GWA2_44_7]